MDLLKIPDLQFSRDKVGMGRTGPIHCMKEASCWKSGSGNGGGWKNITNWSMLCRERPATSHDHRSSLQLLQHVFSHGRMDTYHINVLDFTTPIHNMTKHTLQPSRHTHTHAYESYEHNIDWDMDRNSRHIHQSMIYSFNFVCQYYNHKLLIFTTLPGRTGLCGAWQRRLGWLMHVLSKLTKKCMRWRLLKDSSD